MINFLQAIEKINGENLAVILGDKQLTYRELRENSNQIAFFLSENLKLKGKIIGVKMQRGISLIEVILGILKSGNAYLPLDVSFPAKRLQYMLQVSECQYIIEDSPTSDLLPGQIQTIPVDELLKSKPETKNNIYIENSTQDPVYVMFTSGSTGKPKGVLMPFGAVNNLINWQNKQSAPALITLQFAPVSFDVSFQEIFSTLSSGGTLIVADDEIRTNPEKLAELLQNQKVERIILPYIALHLFALYSTGKGLEFPYLKEVITSGEKLIINRYLRSFFRKNKCTLVNQYGPTESHVVTSYRLEGVPEEWPELPPIGKPIDNCKIMIMNNQGEEVMGEEEGEIWIGGQCLAVGYINQPEMTAEKFVYYKGERYYKSGDFGKLTNSGDILFSGRMDDQVKVRGYRIELSEIEAQLSEIEEVKECAVKSFSSSGITLLAAFYTSDVRLDVLKLKARLAEVLPEYMIPTFLIQLDEMPKTPSGKVDKKSLKVPVNQRNLINIPYRKPKTDEENQLATLWKTLLLLDEIGIDDNVFDLGANSLICIQFSAIFEEIQGKKLPVTKIYQFPTISMQAKYLKSQGAEEILPDERKKKSKAVGSSDIAIIGMALRVPGATTPEEFWQNLINGRESITFFKDHELDPSIEEELKKHPDYVKARGIIEDAQTFDYEFFGINEFIARIMDPQQRKFLEISWECIENAGINIDHIRKSVGVFAGCGNNTYYLNNVLTHPELVEKAGDFQAMTLNEKDYIATKTAYLLDLKGPAISVYTACSTSLTAIAMACESLRANRCDYALAGGSSITSPVNSGYLYNEGGMLSKDGRCRPFDADATGTPFSDGVGVVLLKRLDDAIQDHDFIYAVIKGTGINNDGSGKSSFTAPSVEGQSKAILQALEDADIDPDTVSYVEAHGTATPIGDPIEVEALNIAYGKRKSGKIRYIGSVKSNFGHLTPAAGVIGLIKTVLSLHHHQIPPSINFRQPNPEIDFETNRWKVPVELTDWKENGLPLRAGVSSFGVGGTNVHVILEEYYNIDNQKYKDKNLTLFLVSARNEKALERNVVQLREFLIYHQNIPLEHAAYTMATGRKHFPFRQFFVYHGELEKTFHENNRFSGRGKLKEPPKGVVFMFPGQGSQYAGMGKYFYENETIYRKEFDKCVEICSFLGLTDIKEVMFGEKGNEASDLLKNTKYTQPAVFITEYCLATLMMKQFGIIPDVLMGHSIGEFTAACLSGIFNLEDALKMVVSRAKMMSSMPEGKMLSVRAKLTDIEPYLSKNISIAAVNSPQSVVISGTGDDIDILSDKLTKAGITSAVLHTSHAFHSWMMDPVLAEFKVVVNEVKFSIPRIPIVSTVSTQWLSDHLAVDPDYWTNHLRLTVQFSGAVENILNDGNYCFIEVGPRNALSSLVRQHKTASDISVFGTIGEEPGVSEYLNLLKLFGNLWISGFSDHLKQLYPENKYHKIPLPSYSFEKRYCWIDIPVKKKSIIPEGTELSGGQPQEQQPEKEDTDVETLVRQILEESSGIRLTGIYRETSFADIGLDSLFLTQIAISIQKKTGVKVTFRQLNEELGSIGSLTDYIRQHTELKTERYDEPKLSAAAEVSEEKEKKPFGAIARIETKKVSQISPQLEKFIREFTQKYNQKTRLSKEYTQKYRRYLADPRVVTGFKPHIKELVYQVVVKKSKGCRLWDLDGNEYIDILNGFGSNFFGYAHPEITRSIRKLAKNGYEIGPQHHLAGETARMICEITGNDRAALCNTGSEAVLGLLRIARTVSGKNKVVMFNGSYHGINDEVIVRGGRQLHSYPAAPGVPPEAVQNAVVIDYGEEKSLSVIEELSGELAAVLVEPVQSRRPEFQPFEFLLKLRELCNKKGIVLIFDEVITGFRSHPAGIQGMTGIRADLTSYGKVPGGGMPIGIMAGKADLMDTLDGGYWQFGDDSKPEKGVTYFAGTFVRHPLTLAAAYSSLQILLREGQKLQESLNNQTRMMVDELNSLAKNKGVPLRFNFFASLFRPVFTAEIPFTELLYPLLRFHGVHVLEGFPCFLTLAHTEKDISLIIKAFDDSLTALRDAGIFDLKTRDPNRFGKPPVPGARLGKDPEGNPGWYIPDPEKPGKFLRID